MNAAPKTICASLDGYGTTGIWSDYSSGIPFDENVTSMIMDHASNDGIYISTNRNVYYRQSGMPAWIQYNNGSTSHVLPFLSSHQMEINYKENTLRAGTYGRGIWKSTLVCPSITSLVIPSGNINSYSEAENIITTIGNSNTTIVTGSSPTVFRASTKIVLEPGFTADATSGSIFFTAFIHGCIDGSTSSYNYFKSAFDYSEMNFNTNEEPKDQNEKAIIYPNPASDYINLKLNDDQSQANKQIQIVNIFGQTVYYISELNQSNATISIKNLSSGIYFISINYNGKTQILKFFGSNL